MNVTVDDQIAVLVGGGGYGGAFVTETYHHLEPMLVLPKLIALGRYDNNRILYGKRQPLTLPAGVVADITLEMIHEGGGYGGDQQRAQESADTRAAGIRGVGDPIIGAIRKLGLDSPFILAPHSPPCAGHFKPSVDYLAHLKRGVENAVVMGVTIVPHEEDLYRRFEPSLLVDLKNAGLVTIGVLGSNRSALARRYFRTDQLAFKTTWAASMIAAPHQWGSNKNGIDVALVLSRYGTQATLSFGSRPIPVTNEEFYYRIVRGLFGWTAAGTAKSQAIINALIEAGKDAIRNPHWATLDYPVDMSIPSYLFFTLPLPLTEPSKWLKIIEETEHYFENNFETVTLIWAAGAGTPTPELKGKHRFFAQASWLRILPDFPNGLKNGKSFPTPQKGG